MKKVLFTISFLFVSKFAIGQTDNLKLSAEEQNYEVAFKELRGMLKDSIPMSFKKAVFLTENAYLDNDLSYDAFNNRIQHLVMLCKDMANVATLYYDEKDKNEVAKYWSVYMVMKHRQTYELDSNNQRKPFTPFIYDFDDFWGENDWTKMFVSKLMATAKGNCHSLPFLYKILCEELEAKAYLSMAPNHIYIKHWTKKTGWFNTELTSGYFPIDAWIMASGYVHLSAVQNRIYMDTLDSKQSIAVCLVDLAKGYERKFGLKADLNFIEKSSQLALEYYPNYVNALILKAETMKKRFELYMTQHKASSPSAVFNIPEAKLLFEEMEKLYFHIHQLGYRMMPKEMYIAWLDELKQEKEKYLNKQITNGFNLDKK